MGAIYGAGCGDVKNSGARRIRRAGAAFSWQPSRYSSTAANRRSRACNRVSLADHLTLIDLYIWLLIAAAVLSWLVAFNVVNTRNQFVAMVGDFLYRDHRAGAAADPQHAAQSRRHRHLAGDPDLIIILIKEIIVCSTSSRMTSCLTASAQPWMPGI